MKTLQILEEKITSLITLISELKKKNSVLQEEKEMALTECKEYKLLYDTLTKENEQLFEKVKVSEISQRKDVKQIEVLSSEKQVTKSVVDDLIRSIDSLVEQENQQ